MYNCFKATNDLIGKVPKSTQAEMEQATASCQKAFKSWSKTTPLFRQQIMFKLQHLIKDNLVSFFIMCSNNLVLFRLRNHSNLFKERNSEKHYVRTG